MRTTELEAQIKEIETQLAKLSGGYVGELWVLTPISQQPAPPQPVIDEWMKALDLGHVTALAVPSRHKALTAVVMTPGHDGAPQPDGWTCVLLREAMLGGGHTATTAWHNPTLAALYRSFITARYNRTPVLPKDLN